MIENLLTSTVNVQRPTPSKGTSGAEKDTYTTVYSTLPCSVQPVSTNWLIQYAQRKIDVTHTVYFGSNPTIRNGDRLAFGSRSLMVKGVRDLISLGRVLAVDCLELS